MKKRLLALTLAVVMVLSLLPITAFAAATGLEATAEDMENTPLGNLVRPLPSEGVTVTAKADTEEVSSVAAPGAIDGGFSGNDRWSSAVSSGSHYLQIDLGTQRAVSVIKIYWERDNVIQYNIQGSQDETNWTQLYAQTARDTGNTNQTIQLDAPVKVRYLKINTTQHQSEGTKYNGTTVSWNAVSIMEVEAFRNTASIPVDPAEVAGLVTFSVQNGKVVADTAAADKLAGDWEFEYSFAANLKQVVGADGTVYTPLVNTKVELDVTATRIFDGVTATSDPSQPIKVTVPGQHIANMGNPKPRVIPEIMEWYSSAEQRGESYTLTASSKIVAPAGLNGVAGEVKKDIKDLFDLDLTVATSGAVDGDIVLVLDESKANQGFDDETYLMEVTDRVVITGAHATGVYWGTRSALQALKLSGNRTIDQGTARDYPEFKVRGFVLDVGRKPMSMEKLREMVKNMTWYKLNDFHVHLNDNLITMEDYKTADESWDTDEVYRRADRAYSAFRLESGIQEEEGAIPLTAKDYHYTKAEYKSFVEDSAKLGVTIVSEIDVPAHAKAITDAFPSLQLRGYRGSNPMAQNHPYNDHLDLGTEKYAASLAKTEEIFDEYLDAGIFGNSVHFGADEYYADGTPYRRYVKDMINYLKGKKSSSMPDLTIRQWGSLSTMSSSEAGLTDADLKLIADGVQMNLWNTGWANPVQMYNLGYDLINTVDDNLYIVPNAGYYFDYLNFSSIYNNWTPNCFGSIWLPASSDQVIGAAYAIWNDKIDTQANGIDEVEVYDRFASALPYLSVKMWGEGDKLDRTISKMQTDIAILGNAPCTNPYHDAESAEALNNTFDSDEGLDLTGAQVEGGALVLTGGESYMETGLDCLGYNSSLSFTITVTQAPTGEGQVIFERDHISADSNLAYNEYAIKALPVEGDATKWKLGFSRELYDYEFATEFSLNQEYSLKLTNERSALGAAASAASGTKLYVDGSATGVSAVGAFVNKGDASNTDFEGKTGISKSYFQIPMARIGSKTNSFVGQIGAVSVNSPIKEEPERPEEGAELMNLALNRPVVAQSSNGDTVSRVTDGDVTHTPGDDGNVWQPAQMLGTTPQTPQWFVVDLGEDVAGASLTVEMMAANYWKQGWPQKFKIQTTSDDPTGATAVWTDLVCVERSGHNGWIGSVDTSNIAVHQEGSRAVNGYTLTNSDVINADQMSNRGLQRYVRFYAEEVQKDITQGPQIAMIEFMLWAKVLPTESASNIKAYQIADNEAFLSWDDDGYYQVYAKAPGGEWTCISGEEVVDGNVFTHTGYTEGTVYRVLTPGSEVTSPANTNTGAVDIRTPNGGYVLNTETDRISYSGGWSNWTEAGSYIGPSVQYCNSPTEDLTAELTFVGSGIQLIGGMKNNMGRMTVEIDGVVVGEANFRNASDTPVHQQVVFEQVGLDDGVHTIKLTGVSNSGTVEIEAFRVLVPPESITLSATGLSDGSMTIAAGGSAVTVTATVSPANNSGVFEWTSGDPTVATVAAAGSRPDAQGSVTATLSPVAGGSATITVTDQSDPEVEAEISVTVTQPVTEVALPNNQRSVTLYLNPAAGQSATATLAPEIKPATATNKAVTYSVDKAGVVTVDENGVVTAAAAGTATVTVTTVDGGKTATCAVTVKSNPTGIQVMNGDTQVTEDDPLILYNNADHANKSVTLTAKLTPEGEVTETAVSWTVQEDTSLITVNNGTITATGVSVTSETGHQGGEVTVTVTGATVSTTFKVVVLHELGRTADITGTAQYGETLTVNTASLPITTAGKNALTYQWYRLDTADAEITEAMEPIKTGVGAQGVNYTLQAEDVDKFIAVTFTANTSTYYDGAMTARKTTKVERAECADTPSSAISGVKTTDENNNDGKITGFGDDYAKYEYKGEDDSTWTPVTAAEVTGLTNGNYEVRIAETETHAASEPLTVTVPAYNDNFHAIALGSMTNGMVDRKPEQAGDGAEVTLTVRPSTGYQLKAGTLKVVKADNSEVTVTAKEGEDNKYTFLMPDESVTVKAEFEVMKVKITHNLGEGLSCSLGQHDADGNHVVDYGTVTEITLTADTANGYRLPDSVTVTKTGGSELGRDVVTYENGVIRFPNGVKEDVTVSVTTEQSAYTVSFNSTTPNSNLTSDAPSAAVAHGTALTVTITANTGYSVPDTVEVTMGGTTLAAGTGYTYTPAEDKTTATLSIPSVTGAVSIKAVGSKNIPSITAAAIQGAAVVGGTLRVTGVVPADANYTVEWQRADAEDGAYTQIASADTYELVAADQGKYIRAVVSGTENYSGSVTTDPVGPVGTQNVAVTGITLTPDPATVAVGKTAKIVVTVTPGNATNQNLTWTSGDETVVTVNNAGVVTGVAEGTATITASATDGSGVSATCTVTVTKTETPVTPSKPSTSTTRPSTPTTEVKEDGTKVTTETKPDGTKVETVETPDGTTAVTETKKDGTVTATVEEPDGTKAVTETKPDGSKTATVEQADGTKSETVVTAEGDATITVTDPEGEELVKTEIPATIPEPETKFEDLDKTPWAEEAINKVAGLELVKGIGGNKYDPVTPMTRGALATVLHRLSNGKTDYQVAFKDVKAAQYYTEGVAWAAKANVVKGISEDIFAPDQIITREQLAVMLARYAKLIGMSTKADTKSLEQFTDGGNTGAWAVDGMAWCVEKGILKGKGLNNLDPTADVSRAEVAVMLDRFIALIQK